MDQMFAISTRGTALDPRRIVKMTSSLCSRSIRIAGMEEESVVDGPGIRNTIFLQGCFRHCAGCHNQRTWDYQGGEELTIGDLLLYIKQWKETNPLLDGITISGGEPLCDFSRWLEASEMRRLENLYALVVMSYYTFNGNVILYTGYTFKEIEDHLRMLLTDALSTHYHLAQYALLSDTFSMVRYIVAGPYEQANKKENCTFRGSSNQEVGWISPSRPPSKEPFIVETTLGELWDAQQFSVADGTTEAAAPWKFDREMFRPTDVVCSKSGVTSVAQ